MTEIKVKPKGTIKKLEKEVIQVQKFKNNLITTKEKINKLCKSKSSKRYKLCFKKMKLGKKSLKET